MVEPCYPMKKVRISDAFNGLDGKVSCCCLPDCWNPLVEEFEDEEDAGGSRKHAVGNEGRDDDDDEEEEEGMVVRFEF